MNYWTSTGSSRKKKNDSKKQERKSSVSLSVPASETAEKRKQELAVVDPNSTCRFCAERPAAVCVDLPIVGRLTKRQPTPYCLRCYYSTSAVRQNPTKYVRLLNQHQVDDQLPAIQTMFSEAFLELQQEISYEAELAFQRRRNSSDDPLASLMMMGGINNGNKSKKRRISSSANAGAGASAGTTTTNRVGRAGKADDGGFLRDAQIPERFLKTQQHQRQLQQQRLDRLNRASSAAVGGRSTTREGASRSYVEQAQQLSKRRKGSRKSIWNLAMERPTTGEGTRRQGGEDPLLTKMMRKKPPPLSISSSARTVDEMNDHGVVCSSCSSSDVHSFGNITSRNADVRKGEIWGSGSRGDGGVINRYQCNQCGKTWNEEE